MSSTPASPPSPSPAPFDDGLERGEPSDVGVDADQVLAFLDDVEAAGLEMHSMMLHRNGRVVAEGWRWPYRADRPRILHSAAKSYTACAIGMAVDEGRFALSDKVTSFFPRELPDTVSDKLAAMTVEDLLTMRTGQASETSGSIWRGLNTSWIAEFFKIPLVHPPGANYVYTSAASYMLSAVLSRTTGETLHDYLKPRLFEPLGTVDESWDIGPDGLNPGGNGLTARTADLLKLGILHAQGGIWQGRRLLSEAWVSASTRAQGPGEGRYGYHWAVRPANAFSAIGIFVQAATVYPAQGATLTVTGAMESSVQLFAHYEPHFPKAFQDPPRANPEADARLKARLAGWRTPRALPPSAESALATQAGGLVFAMEANTAGVTRIEFDFTADRCLVRLTDAEGEHALTAGLGQWLEGRTDMPGRDLHHGYRLRGAVVVASARWLDKKTLEMVWIFAETAFRDTVVCRFDNGRLSWKRSVNINSGVREHPELVGAAAG